MDTFARNAAVLLLSALVGWRGSIAAQATPCGSFSFASGADPAGDLLFQASLCGFAEEDFESYANGASVPQIMIGSVAIDVNIVDDSGALLADDAEIFASGSFNVPEVMSRNALLNRSRLSGAVGRIEFVFPQPVESFGAWLFDDFGSDDPLTFEILEVGGGVHSDGPRTLQAGTGIEGFFGFRSCVGIERVRVKIASSFLELDHIQVGGTISAAQAVLRNGSGVNRACYTALPPVLGTPWTATVDVSAQASVVHTIIVGYAGSLAGSPSPYGEVLVDASSPLVFRSYAVPIGGMSTHSSMIPADPCLAGRVIHTQAVIIGRRRAELCNAIDMTLGY